MKDFIKQYYKFIIGGIIAAVLILQGSVWAKQVSIKYEEKEPNVEELTIKEDNKENVKTVTVDIKGEVENPGVYTVLEDTTVYQVIKKAGGLTAIANTDKINLSKKVTDEMVIIIYDNKETSQVNQISNSNCPDSLNQACIDNNESYQKVSLNKGTKEEFMTLKGVGESKALEIIKYRDENISFKAIEEVKNVPGIGEALYENIKDYLTL